MKEAVLAPPRPILQVDKVTVRVGEKNKASEAAKPVNKPGVVDAATMKRVESMLGQEHATMARLALRMLSGGESTIKALNDQAGLEIQLISIDFSMNSQAKEKAIQVIQKKYLRLMEVAEKREIHLEKDLLSMKKSSNPEQRALAYDIDIARKRERGVDVTALLEERKKACGESPDRIAGLANTLAHGKEEEHVRESQERPLGYIKSMMAAALAHPEIMKDVIVGLVEAKIIQKGKEREFINYISLNADTRDIVASVGKKAATAVLGANLFGAMVAWLAAKRNKEEDQARRMG